MHISSLYCDCVFYVHIKQFVNDMGMFANMHGIEI